MSRGHQTSREISSTARQKSANRGPSIAENLHSGSSHSVSQPRNRPSSPKFLIVDKSPGAETIARVMMTSRINMIVQAVRLITVYATAAFGAATIPLKIMSPMKEALDLLKLEEQRVAIGEVLLEPNRRAVEAHPLIPTPKVEAASREASQGQIPKKIEVMA